MHLRTGAQQRRKDIHVVDRIFRHHLQGAPHTFRAPRSEKVPEFQALARSAVEVDDWYAWRITPSAAARQ